MLLRWRGLGIEQFRRSRIERECVRGFLIVVDYKNRLTRRRTRRALTSVDHLKCHVGLVFFIRFLQP